ncbi:unnamed protein product [Rhizophagus irregularis]|nr:unnamed protein product [Rhizophagus irregularis]
MFEVILTDKTKYLILGSKSNYIEMSTPKEGLNNHCKDAYTHFQNDLKKNIKNPIQFAEFLNNINLIWEKIPSQIKVKYGPLKELEN